MIGLTIQGRLGNQLFQYAFIYSTSKKLDKNFFIDQSVETFTVAKYFCVKLSVATILANHIFSIKGYKNLFNYHLRIIYSKILIHFLIKNVRHFDFKTPVQEVLKSISDKSLYNGYFQSESYFKDNEIEIRNLFRLKDQLKNKYHNTYQTLGLEKKRIAVHIRKTDFQNQGHLNLGNTDISLPMSFYHSIIASLNQDDSFFIFISDDPASLVKEFEYIKHKHISFSDEITDFQHMLNADICITSNSTFSWWAAYLNENPNKIIYAPKYFMGIFINQEVPPFIYPSNWIQVKC